MPDRPQLPGRVARDRRVTGRRGRLGETEKRTRPSRRRRKRPLELPTGIGGAPSVQQKFGTKLAQRLGNRRWPECNRLGLLFRRRGLEALERLRSRGRVVPRHFAEQHGDERPADPGDGACRAGTTGAAATPAQRVDGGPDGCRIAAKRRGVPRAEVEVRLRLNGAALRRHLHQRTGRDARVDHLCGAHARQALDAIHERIGHRRREALREHGVRVADAPGLKEPVVQPLGIVPAAAHGLPRPHPRRLLRRDRPAVHGHHRVPHPHREEDVRGHVQRVGGGGRELRIQACRPQAHGRMHGVVERVDHEVRGPRMVAVAPQHILGDGACLHVRDRLPLALVEAEETERVEDLRLVIRRIRGGESRGGRVEQRVAPRLGPVAVQRLGEVEVHPLAIGAGLLPALRRCRGKAHERVPGGGQVLLVPHLVRVRQRFGGVGEGERWIRLLRFAECRCRHRIFEAPVELHAAQERRLRRRAAGVGEGDRAELFRRLGMRRGSGHPRRENARTDSAHPATPHTSCARRKSS